MPNGGLSSTKSSRPTGTAKQESLKKELARLESLETISIIEEHCKSLKACLSDTDSLSKIDLYRTKLIETSSQDKLKSIVKYRLDSLSKEINAFIQKSVNLNPTEIKKQELEYFLKLSLVKAELKREIFAKEGIMQLINKQPFVESQEHLEIRQIIPDSTGKSKVLSLSSSNYF